MPQYTGLTKSERPLPVGNLTYLLFGTAPDGTVGQSRWFTSADEVSYVYGAISETRWTPAPTDSSYSCPWYFLPDDPSLVRSQATQIYQFDPATSNPLAYQGFGSFVATGRPTVLTFDQMGYDASVTPLDGGLFIESEATSRDGFVGSLVLPLLSAFQEHGDSTYCAIGGCRVGTSWLPSDPAVISASFMVTTEVSGAVAFQCTQIGDGGLNDRYVSCCVIVKPTELILDPGFTGLPYRRIHYAYANFATWNALFDQIGSDFQSGYLPYQITNCPARNSAAGLATPGAGYVGTESPVTFIASYDDVGYSEPDLTLALTWANILEQEDLPIQEGDFISFAGLTGQALAADPTSALRIFKTIENLQYQADEDCDPILVLPWSLTAPDPTVVYDPAADVASFQELISLMTDQSVEHLLIIWGTMTQSGLQPDLDGSNLIVPVAYSAVAAVIREVEQTDSNSDPTINALRPVITTMMNSGVSPLLIAQSAAPPSPIVPTTVPSPTTLETLRSNGIIPVTRSLGSQWSLVSPMVNGNGDTFSRLLVQAVFRTQIESVLDPYLGQPGTPAVLNNLKGSLTTLQQQLTQSTDAISRQISSVTLTLQTPTNLSSLTILSVNVTLALFGETDSIAFQVSVTA